MGKIIKYIFGIFLFVLAVSFFACVQAHEVSCEGLKKKYIPQSSPEESIRLELELLAQGIYCYDLPLFDSAWRKKGKEILHSGRYKETAEKFNVSCKVYKEGKYAVVYYPGNKSLGPEFLYRNSEGWVLDRTAVWDYIHYNRTNSGWFAYEGNYPYLKMLKKIFSLKKVRLDSGVWAYQIKE